MADLKTLTIDGVSRLTNPAHMVSAYNGSITLAANTLYRTDYIEITEPGVYAIFLQAMFGTASTTGVVKREYGFVTEAAPTSLVGVVSSIDPNQTGNYKKTANFNSYDTPVKIAGAIRSDKAASSNSTMFICAVKIANID